MLVVLLILWSSVLVGFLLRRWPQPWVSKLLTISIWLMLFIIGIEVGGNEVLVESLGQLGPKHSSSLYSPPSAVVQGPYCCGDVCSLKSMTAYAKQSVAQHPDLASEDCGQQCTRALLSSSASRADACWATLEPMHTYPTKPHSTVYVCYWYV